MDEPAAPRISRSRVKMGAIVVLALVGLGSAVLVSALGNHGSSTELARAPVEALTGEPLATGAILVHILGAVEQPGLYELHEGDRAIDAVAAAGGFLETADQAQLNLARLVVDGEQINVPIIGEGTPSTPGAAADGTVNINTADAAALDTLPRVGPAMAARILEWRETNGRFTAIEELMNVTGIGEKTFDGLKTLVSL